MSNTICFLLLALIILVSSCGGSKGDNISRRGDNISEDHLNGGSNNSAMLAASSVEEAMSMLSKKHKLLFAQWTKNLLKSCNGEDIFKPNATNKDSLDLDVFIEKLGRDQLVMDEQNNFVLLGEAKSHAGTSTSEYKESENINGTEYQLQAKLERHETHCNVWLYGQKVHTAEIVQSIPVLASSIPSSESYTKLKRKPISRRYREHSLTKLTQHGFNELVGNYLKPISKSLDLIGARLGVDKDVTTKFFSMNSSAVIDGAYKLSAPFESLYFNSFSTELIVLNRDISDLFKVDAQNGKLIVHIGFDRYEKGNNGVWRLERNQDKGLLFSLNFNLRPMANGQMYEYSIVSAANKGKQSLNNKKASKCFEDLALKFMEIDSNQNQIVPSYGSVKSVCQVLAPNYAKALEESQALYRVLDRVLTKSFPSKHFNYNGWDKIFSKNIVNKVENGENLSEKLLVSRNLEFVQNAFNYFTQMNEKLAENEKLERYRDQLYSTAISWALSGQNITSSFFDEFAYATNNTIVVLGESTRAMLNSLYRNASGADREIKFASQIDEDYKSLAQELKILSDNLDYQEWQNSYLNKILQIRPSKEELGDWKHKLSEIKSRLEQYPRLSEYKGKLTRIIIKALDRNEIASIDTENITFSLNNSMDPFKEATLHLMDSLEKSLADCQLAIDFAASLSQEYKNKSIETKMLSNQLGLSDWQDAFFKNVLFDREEISTLESWIRTLKASKEFLSRDQARNGGETSFGYKRKRKDLLAKALDEAWDKREFSLIERIGKLGVYKTMCDRHKDLVSLVDCIGIDFFSKKSEMALYLDFGERYGILAEAMVDHLKNLSPEFDFSSIRRDLTRNFFGTFRNPVWSKCSNERFNKKFGDLNQEIDNLIQTSDQFRRWDIERNIREILKDCRQ